MAFTYLDQVLVEERNARLRAEADGWRLGRQARAAKKAEPNKKPAVSRRCVSVPIEVSPAGGQKEERARPAPQSIDVGRQRTTVSS